jgi:endonuclease-3
MPALKTVMQKTARIMKAAELLEEEYGLPRWAHELHDPVSTLIGTILSQNTSDKNSRPAYKSLRKKYPKWEKLLKARDKDIAKTIKRGGLANIKAKRIKNVLKEIKKRKGKLSLSFLKNKPKREAREFLLSLEGVGPKTAAIVLMFGFGVPTFPVDTHLFRLSKRLGFISNKASYEKAHDLMDKLVPDEKKASFHVNLIYLGREVCHARRPKCSKCKLKKICPSAFKF